MADALAVEERATRAIAAAFPDRADPLLDVVERALRVRRGAPPSDGRDCVFCLRGHSVRYPLVAPDDRSYTLAPVSPEPPWPRVHEGDPEAPVACLDCLWAASEELGASRASGRTDRVLADAVRALRASGRGSGEDGDGTEEAVAALEAAFAATAGPAFDPAITRCAICGPGETRGGVAGPGGALCTPCLRRHWGKLAQDPLTGLEYRRLFWHRLELAAARARRLGRPLSLLLVDLDHLKAFNDLMGFRAGDAVLARVPDAIRPCLGARDVACRWGGEEFAVLLPGHGAAEAAAVAEAIRERALATLLPRDEAGDVLSEETVRWVYRRDLFPERAMTVSVGVAALQDGMDAAALVRLADERLLHAKNAGRNRVSA